MKLEIHMDAWIIQDGNYPDFYQGGIQRFALLAFPENHQKLKGESKSIHKTDYGQYDLVGKVVWQNQQVTVLDFGLRAYIEMDLTKEYGVGDYITGSFMMTIDYYYYFEVLSKINGIPPLIYTWKIEDIALNQVPFIQKKEGNYLVFVRDATKIKFASIPATDAWKDDDGNGHYLLTINKMNQAPTLHK